MGHVGIARVNDDDVADDCNVKRSNDDKHES
jgi:hypothetical protein